VPEILLNPDKAPVPEEPSARIAVATALGRVLTDHSILFYYEAHELEFADGTWRHFSPDRSWPVEPHLTHVTSPLKRQLEGFDVVIFWLEGSADPEHAPLSCQGLAEKLSTNAHCIFDTFDQAYTALNTGKFNGCEPGALRIFAVYSVAWPSSNFTSA
jgi:hypothetical protein